MKKLTLLLLMAVVSCTPEESKLKDVSVAVFFEDGKKDTLSVTSNYFLKNGELRTQRWGTTEAIAYKVKYVKLLKN